MHAILTFIVENPFLFLIIALIIYTLITYSILKNKISNIEKAFKPINDYLNNRFDEISTLINQLLNTYKEEEKVTNELIRILDGINKAKTGSVNDIIKTSNDINSFILNTGLLKTSDYPELNILYHIELFPNLNTEEAQDIIKRKNKFNELITDYNHDILNPPNSIIVSLFNMKKHFLVIESNVGKNPGSSVINYINIETLTNESSPVKDSGTKAPEITKAPLTKKVCPSCKNETNEGFCPKCGTKIE